MIIIEKNEGAKIPYATTGTKVSFDDDLTIKLSSREQDWPVHIDVCYDEDHALVIGAAAGRVYVAEIDIPERQYTETEVEVDGEMEIERTPVALNMDTVRLTLWSIE